MLPIRPMNKTVMMAIHNPILERLSSPTVQRAIMLSSGMHKYMMGNMAMSEGYSFVSLKRRVSAGKTKGCMQEANKPADASASPISCGYKSERSAICYIGI